jgi:threonine dehydratase
MPPVSIADGLRTSLGRHTFEILKEHLSPEDVILVNEEEIVSATQLVFERMKLVVEPSSATVVAAVLKDGRFRGKRVCCIISGGNIDMSALFASLRSQAKL